MPKRSLLLVDGDTRSLRVLEVSLKKAGFTVTTAANGQDALAIVEASPPDLIISNTVLEALDGFEFCRAVKANAALEATPFVFLTDQTEIEHKIRGLELGVDEYLIKPIYIKEILTRVRILLQKRDRNTLEGRKESNTRFTGKLSDMGVVDLIQTVEVSHKSGVSHFTAPDDQVASLYFREGRVIDAELGPLTGAEAVYRLLTWNEGDFEVLFRPVRRRDVIALSPQALLMEGMRRLDEWGRLLEQLPDLSTRFEVAYESLADRLSELPDELNHILRLFDGHRALMDIVDQTPQGDLESLELIAKLYFEGLVVESTRPPPNHETWPPPIADRQEPIDLPPARIRPAAADELEHEPGDQVFEDLELGRAGGPSYAERAAASTEEAEPAEPPAPDPAPREDSLVDLAIGAAAPVFKGPLPTREMAAVVPPPELLAEAEAILGSSEPAPPEPEGTPEPAPLGATATVTEEEELGRMPTKKRQVAMIPQLVEKVRNRGERHSSSPPTPAANDASNEANGVAATERETVELEAETDPTRDSPPAAKADSTPPPISASDSTPPPVAKADSTPPPIPASDSTPPPIPPSDSTPPPVAASDSPSSAPTESERPAPDGAPGLVAIEPETSSAIDAPVATATELDDEPAVKAAVSVLPTVEIEEEAITEATPIPQKYPAFDDEETPLPEDLEPLPPSSLPGDRDDIRVISSDGAEIVAVAGAISSESSEATRRQRPDGSVVIDDEDLRDVEEPTVEEPLGQRARRSSPPPKIPDPPERRNPLPLFFGVAAAAVLMAGILFMRRGPSNTVPSGGAAADAMQTTAVSADAGAVTPEAADGAVPTTATADAAVPTVALADAAPVRSVDAATEKTPKEEARELARAASRARSRGRHAEALGLINEAISLRPSGRYLAIRADLLLALGKRREAVMAADAAISRSRRTASAWLTKGLAHYELRAYGAAKAAFQRYLELRPNAKDADEIRSLIDTL